jgi:predicted nucleotidyltransferase
VLSYFAMVTTRDIEASDCRTERDLLARDAAMVRAAFEARLREREATTSARVEGLRASLPRLRAALAEAGAARVWLIGSLAWGRPHPGSDLDLVTEGASEHAIADLRVAIARLCDVPVDVMRLEALPPAVADRIRRHGEELAT